MSIEKDYQNVSVSKINIDIVERELCTAIDIELSDTKLEKHRSHLKQFTLDLFKEYRKEIEEEA
jgi:hypothetical protein|tara:strand:+ start:105 stop:296 length:192 start_codon:yes stop_codon:yes gene_type:complete